MVKNPWGRRRLDPDGFETLLAKHGPPSSLFLVGPEVLLRDEVAARMEKAVLGDASGGHWNREVYQARDLPLAELNAGLRVVGLFADTRLVLVSDAERYGRSSQADRTELWAWMDQPSPGIHLLLMSEKPLWELERANEFVKGTLSRSDAVVRCEHPTYAKAVQVAVQLARERYKMTLPETVARRLVDAVGPDLLELANEVDRLSLRFGIGTTIETVAMDDWLRTGSAATLLDLEEALFAGDAARALRCWDSVKHKMSPPAVTWMLGGKHLDGRWGRGQSGSPVDRGFLSLILRECYRLERSVKSGETPSALQETAFEEMIVRVCLRSRGTMRP